MSDAARRKLATLFPDVSRETWGQLEAYVEILLKWQKAINLIGPATVDDIWSRHILELRAGRCRMSRPEQKDWRTWGRAPDFPAWSWRRCGPISTSS